MKIFQKNKNYPNIKQLNNENFIGISVEALECKICFDLFDKIPCLIKCGHSFCYKCISLLRIQASCLKTDFFQCPLCTKPMSLFDDTIPNYAFDEVLQYASLATQNNLVPQKKDQSKLLKTLEIQKKLYADACKTLGSIQKEKMPHIEEILQLKKDLQKREEIIFFLAIFVIILIFICFALAANSGHIQKRSL